MTDSVKLLSHLLMCRLCLNYSENCIDIFGDKPTNSSVRDKIKKYLYIEVELNTYLNQSEYQIVFM